MVELSFWRGCRIETPPKISELVSSQFSNFFSFTRELFPNLTLGATKKCAHLFCSTHLIQNSDFFSTFLIFLSSILQQFYVKKMTLDFQNYNFLTLKLTLQNYNFYYNLKTWKCFHNVCSILTQRVWEFSQVLNYFGLFSGSQLFLSFRIFFLF